MTLFKANLPLLEELEDEDSNGSEIDEEVQIIISSDWVCVL
jgi:hypothetical protein